MDQDDWRTVEWHNLNDFLNQLVSSKTNFVLWTTMPTTTTSIMTSSIITSLTTFTTATEHRNVLPYDEITRNIINQINAMNICPDKEFAQFKLLIQKYFKVYKRLLCYIIWIKSSHSEVIMERFRVLTRNILAYKELFMTAIDHEVNSIFFNK